MNRVVHAFSQGQARGRCSVSRRAEDAIRAGTRSWGTQTRSRPQSRHAPPSAERAQLDAVDRQATQVEQTRGLRYQIVLNMGNLRTLKQARGLTLIMNAVLTAAMITRSRASYVSALDPSCTVKSEEPH